MVKFGSVLGALFGAGGAAAYYNGATEQGTLLNYLLGSPSLGTWGKSAPGQAGPSADYEQLSRAVERLARDVRSQGQGVTVIHGSQGTSAVFTYGGVFLVSAMGIMYIRGWKLSDFLYVTRASLQKSMATVTTSVEGLTQRMSNVKQIIGQQIDAVKRRQEEAMKAQEELKEQMNTVGTDVESTRSNVEEVHSDLTRLGGDVQALSEQQAYATDGIYLLCRVLGDIVHQSNKKYPELDSYLRRPPNRRVQGFESLQSLPGGMNHNNALRLTPAASSPSELETDKMDVLAPMRQKSGLLSQNPWWEGRMANMMSRQASAGNR